MRFEKILEDVELPEKTEDGRFINIRSCVRMDIQPGKFDRVPTGLRVEVEENEKPMLYGSLFIPVVNTLLKPGEVFIRIKNDTERNITIYPGQVLAEVTVYIGELPKKPKRATIYSSANLTIERDIPMEPGFHKKPCETCPDEKDYGNE